MCCQICKIYLKLLYPLVMLWVRKSESANLNGGEIGMCLFAYGLGPLSVCMCVVQFGILCDMSFLLDLVSVQAGMNVRLIISEVGHLSAWVVCLNIGFVPLLLLKPRPGMALSGAFFDRRTVFRGFMYIAYLWRFDMQIRVVKLDFLAQQWSTAS